MKCLLDTNVVSEWKKGERADRGVRSWFELAHDDDLFLSVLTLGEVRRGAELKRKRDAVEARSLEAWLASLTLVFADRILPIDREVSEVWGRFASIRPIPAVDGLLAATAHVNGLTLVTRNTDDFEGLDVELLNPFGN